MRRLLILGLSVSLAACAGGPPPEVATPTPELPSSFFFEPDPTTSEALGSLLPTEDAAFVELARQGIERSPNLAEALARVDAARAGARRSGAERLPNIGANANVTGNRTNPNQFGGNTPFSQFIDTEQVSYGANLTATWDADIFGRLRAQESAALARVDAANATASAVRIALLAEIAGAVIDWRTLDARIEAIGKDVASAGQLAELARSREEAGIAPGFDRVRAQAAASASRSAVEAVEKAGGSLTTAAPAAE